MLTDAPSHKTDVSIPGNTVETRHRTSAGVNAPTKNDSEFLKSRG